MTDDDATAHDATAHDATAHDATAQDATARDVATEVPAGGRRIPFPRSAGDAVRRISSRYRRKPLLVAAIAVVLLGGLAAGLLISAPWETNDGARTTSAYCAVVKEQNSTLDGLDVTSAGARDKVATALGVLDTHAPGAIHADTTLVLGAFQKLASGDLSPIADPAKQAALTAAANRIDGYTSKTCGVSLAPAFGAG